MQRENLVRRLSVSDDLILGTAAELTDNGADKSFGVSEKHQRLIEIVKWIIDSGETGTHAAFDDHYGASFINIQNWHAIDWAAGIASSRGICDVVRANHQRNVCLRKIAINFVEVQQLVVGDVRFGQQHIHVPGHAASYRMNTEFHVHAALG